MAKVLQIVFNRLGIKMKAAAYCGTRNLYEDMITAAKSLLINSDVDKIYFLIEDDEFPYYLPDCIETINVSGQQYFKEDCPNYKSKWTYMVLIRVVLTKFLPQDLDKVLSIDVDTIVDKDVSDLWDIPLDGYWFAAAKEPKKSTNSFLYINNGVTMQNLKKLREDKKDDDLVSELHKKKWPCTEQDVINGFAQKGIKKIPSDYNVCNYTEPCTSAKIIHFAAVERWNHLPLVQKYKAIPWSEIRGGI